MTSNYEIKKGDIYYAMLDPVIGSEQDGKRPVVVIQNNLANKHSPTVIVAPITTVIKKTYLLTHIIIYKNNFLKKDSTILIEQIRVIDKSRITAYLGKLTEFQIQKIDKALVNAFAIDIERIEKNGQPSKTARKKSKFLKIIIGLSITAAFCAAVKYLI